MANIELHRGCRICDRPIPAKRAATYPDAVLCGAPKCSLTDHRQQRNLKAKRQRDKRIAADPNYRTRQLEKCRYYYVKRRLAAGKTPALRAPLVAHDLTDGLGWLRGVWASTLGSLKRMAADAWASRSRAAQSKREQARVYESLVWVLTRQGTMDPIKGPADAESGES